MSQLAENWFISDVFDVEYKTYQVLDYVQKTNAHFERNELFPYFDYLLRHLHCLSLFRHAKKEIDAGMFGMQNTHPQIDEFKSEVSVTKSVSDLNEIIAFAQNHFLKCRTNGERQLAKLYEKLHISQIGIQNPSATGGLIIINQKHNSRLYTFEHRIVKRPNTYFQYKDVKTCFTKQLSANSSSNPYEIKWQYLKSDKFNTAVNTYLVESEDEIPHFETIIPLVKNHLLTISEARVA